MRGGLGYGCTQVAPALPRSRWDLAAGWVCEHLPAAPFLPPIVFRQITEREGSGHAKSPAPAGIAGTGPDCLLVFLSCCHELRHLSLQRGYLCFQVRRPCFHCREDFSCLPV